MSRFTEMTDEQWQAAFDEFISKYNPPSPERVRCLNLIMRKPFAEAILRGEKKVEFRSFSQHYVDRLTDKKVDKWMTEHEKMDGFDAEAMHEFMVATRPVQKIHFHNYNNSWFLDVTCPENAAIGVTRPSVEDLQERFNCHEFDEMLADFEAKKSDMRPIYFYFVIGDILETNLQVKD